MLLIYNRYKARCAQEIRRLTSINDSGSSGAKGILLLIMGSNTAIDRSHEVRFLLQENCRKPWISWL